jgi:hypothetical protein
MEGWCGPAALWRLAPSYHSDFQWAADQGDLGRQPVEWLVSLLVDR